MVKGLHNISDDEDFPPLPPPHSPGQGGQDDGDPFENGDEGGDVSKLADVPAAKRKTVKRPQPKLDSQRLISERGLPALRTLFDGVHFKGKGHEAADLGLLMQKMENWAHRLYPKLQFDDFIDKIEKLGAKKEVQTCLKRIRLDMPLTHEDFIDKDGEEGTAPELRMFDDPDPFNETIFADKAPSLVHSTPAPAAPPASPAFSVAPSPAVPSLTEEQRRRMELNRQRALERRLARNQQQQTDSQSVDTAPSADESMSFSSENILDKSNNQKEELEQEQESQPEPKQEPEPQQEPQQEQEPELEPQPEQEPELEPQPEQEMELELQPKLEPISSETQPPSQPPHKDSEPSAKSRQHEEEKETSVIISPGPSSEQQV